MGSEKAMPPPFSRHIRRKKFPSPSTPKLYLISTSSLSVYAFLESLNLTDAENTVQCILNDLLSFHKEQLVGEQHNFVHLYHQSIKSTRICPGEHWSLSDTIRDICDKLAEATHRVDAHFGITRADNTAKGKR